MTKAGFIQYVLTILNEADNMIDGSEMIGADSVNLPLYIEKHFPAAWRRAVKVLPAHWFKPNSFSDETHIQDKPQGTGYIFIPGDFLRFVSFKMEGWERAVTEVEEEGSDIAAMQGNRYVRGNWKRPVCVMRTIAAPSNSPKGGEQVETKQAVFYYSLPETAENDEEYKIEYALYIQDVKKIKEDNEGEMAIDERLIEPLAYLLASQVMTGFEKHDLAERMDKRAAEMV